MAGKHKVILSERAREDLLRLVDEGYGDKVDGMLTGLEEDIPSTLSKAVRRSRRKMCQAHKPQGSSGLQGHRV